ncbi:hypothetical protein BEWA_031290 [Theileria equi strain WA]|uniref:Uncharacterized protein n=1 Tax=Theileria equi strain WA TaxID=1537102 RepID=L0AZ32_THEEQ|nr:hypothetical protein BEWA_031290 [Theileria equi strain WA]AFZ80276.1 hypothetical protein BEWA_031290 [Theileria equi strain WA]|eukprot:XP_004829942.1 hypothetical protein BEWA_031290 [Theileria equi strain WA]
MTALPGVTIDIKESPDGSAEKVYTVPPYGSTGQQVKLTKEENPPGFLKFTHTKNGGGSFTVEKVIYGQNNYSKDYKMELKIPEHEGIQHIAVWYWNNDPSLNNPLLVEVKMRDGNFIYSSNKGGNSWQPLSGYSNPQHNQLQGEKLETQLDGLNCRLNDAVTITLTFQNSEVYKNKSYCCDYHNPNATSGRVSVTIDKVRCTRGHNSADYYKHTISSNYKLAKIKYHITNGDRKWRRIKSDDLSFPITSSVSVYALYCKQDPKLIYIEGGSSATGWYKKKDGGSNGNEEWTKVPDLRKITHRNLDAGTLNHEQYNQLVGALKEAGCTGLRICPDPPPPPPPPPPPLPGGAGNPGPKGPLGKGGKNGNETPTRPDTGELIGPAGTQGRDDPTGVDAGGPGSVPTSPPGTAATGPDGKPPTLTTTTTTTTTTTEVSDAVPGPGEPQRSIGAAPAAFGLGLILKISSGVFGGSGAVGLAGYHLYKHTRDPWVRQI